MLNYCFKNRVKIQYNNQFIKHFNLEYYKNNDYFTAAFPITNDKCIGLYRFNNNNTRIGLF